MSGTLPATTTLNVVDVEVAADGTRYPIRGHVAAGFGPVLEAFVDNFRRGEETGSRATGTMHGGMVFDLWGGFADAAHTRPWRDDTIVLMMSVAKGFAAASIHMLADRGKIDLDAPVARCWPEFAAVGKADVPVRWILDHRAGLPALAGPAPADIVCDPVRFASLLAAQPPLWQPGTQAGYHIFTMGTLAGEIVRRVDGRSIGQFVADEIAKPLGLDYRIGTPAAEFHRVADFIEAREGTITAADPDSLLARAWGALLPTEGFNGTPWRTAQIAGANGIGHAAAVARFYAALALGGALDGVRVMSANAVRGMSAEQHNETEIVMGRTYHQAAGVLRNSPPIVWMGPNPNAFGHHGVGGAIGFADPDARLSFAYSPNRMHARLDNGPRAGSLVRAFYDCL